MNYNQGYKYNVAINKGGLGYNNVPFRIIINLYEVLNISDDVKLVSALLTLYDRPRFSEFITTTALETVRDSFRIETNAKVNALIEVAERLNIFDELSELLVMLYLNDKFEILDQVKMLSAYLEIDDNFKISDKTNITALIKLADQYGLKDASKLFALIDEYDKFSLLDREPRTAVSDFVIGKIDNLDNTWDWLAPFNMMVDWRNSTIQVMPQSESNYIEMPAVDGSIPEYTVYKNRIFNLITYSPDGLTVAEKEELKRHIDRVLDATKHETKKLTFQAAGTAFDVKYSGVADFAEGPSFVRATIPLEAGPYGYPLFDNEVVGTGILINDGAADVGPVNYISGGAVNPSFRMGNTTYTWTGTVPTRSTLVIDHEAYMCYLETDTGTRTNAIQNLTGDFMRVPKESSVAITAFGNTGSYLRTTIKERLLW